MIQTILAATHSPTVCPDASPRRVGVRLRVVDAATVRTPIGLRGPSRASRALDRPARKHQRPRGPRQRCGPESLEVSSDVAALGRMNRWHFRTRLLLLPGSLLLDEYNISSGLEEVERLAEDAEASLEAAATRLVGLSDESVALIVLEVGHKPADRSELRKGQSVPKRLRVRYAKSRALSTYVPRFKSVSEGSPYGEALATGRLVTGVGTLPGSNSTKFWIEAKRYDRGSSDGIVERVLALVRPRQSQ
jgi:hypothetical protein